MKLCVYSAFLVCVFGGTAVRSETIYQNDFQSVELGQEPEDFLVLDGGFVVREKDSDHYLQLPGTPLENFGALFGPSRRDGMRISIRIKGQNKRRLAPAFGVGLHGLGGFKLMVSANKRKLELLRGDEVLTAVDFQWQSVGWTQILFEARPAGESGWIVRGKVWNAGGSEPGDWSIEFSASSAPPRGKASIWGHPFSGHPIGYDAVKVEALAPLG